MKSLAKDKESTMETLDSALAETGKRKSKLTDVRQTCKQTELDIKSESQKLRQLINLQEKKLLEELESVAHKEIGKLEADIKTREMRVQMYQQQSEVIENALTSDCQLDIYQMWPSCESGSTDMDGIRQTELKKRIPDRIHLRKNNDQLVEVLNGLQFGEFEVKHDGEMDLKNTPVLQHIIDVREASGQGRACPVDVKVLDVTGINTVVVTEWISNQSNVKSFYSRNGQSCSSKLSLEGSPWGLTQLTPNQVAVVVPDTRQIVTIEVNPNLVLLSTTTTQKQYWCITTLTPSTVAVGSMNSPYVDILDMTGAVIRSISASTSGRCLLGYPYFLSTTVSGNLLVSDCRSKSLLCLTPQGDVVFNFSTTHLNPRGIAVTDTGDILVADWTLKRVIHLTESGKIGTNILTLCDGCAEIYGIALDKQGQIYICCGYESVIKVFKYKTGIYN